jgi:hypothetical protein
LYSRIKKQRTRRGNEGGGMRDEEKKAVGGRQIKQKAAAPERFPRLSFTAYRLLPTGYSALIHPSSLIPHPFVDTLGGAC